MKSENSAKMRFPVGTIYTPRGKHSKPHAVIDYHVTRNLAGEIVRCRYVSVCQLLGQDLIDYDVAETTIARGEPVLP